MTASLNSAKMNKSEQMSFFKKGKCRLYGAHYFMATITGFGSVRWPKRGASPDLGKIAETAEALMPKRL
jgi:hypothetical protein